MQLIETFYLMAQTTPIRRLGLTSFRYPWTMMFGIALNLVIMNTTLT